MIRCRMRSIIQDLATLYPGRVREGEKREEEMRVFMRRVALRHTLSGWEKMATGAHPAQTKIGKGVLGGMVAGGDCDWAGPV